MTHSASADTSWLGDDRIAGLDLHLQPIVRTRNGTVSHYEALTRIVPRSDEAPAPCLGSFLERIEARGDIIHLDHWVIQRAASLLAVNSSLPAIAVNLSAAGLAQEGLIPRVRAELIRADVDPRRLTFEITETTGIRDFDLADRQLRALRRIGCGTALDDFGSGFSSFEYLRHLQVDIVKLDRSLISAIATDPVDYAVVRAIVDVALLLGRHTVAEGVEDLRTLQEVDRLQVSLVQGYLLGRPRSVQQTLHLQRQRATPSEVVECGNPVESNSEPRCELRA
jgi:EAL domain-containing protein (putative c-di-GMP-specific phosphodiesterase class I)